MTPRFLQPGSHRVSVITTEYLSSALGALKRLIQSEVLNKASSRKHSCLFITLHMRGESENVGNSAGLIHIFEQGVTR